MLYAIAQDMQDRYPVRDLIQITDPNGVALDEAVLARALGDASAEIDSYLEGRYPLPLVAVPESLKVLACSIAMYRLQALRPLQDVEDARKRYEDAVRFLRSVAKGEINLGLSAGAQPARAANDALLATDRAGDRQFSRDRLRGF